MLPKCLSFYAISALPHSLSRRNTLEYCRHGSRLMQYMRQPNSLSCQERVRVRHASDFARFDGQPCLTHSPIITRR
jgi:hypothetical protein